MPKDTMGNETYVMKTLMNFLGISRSTLRYYEQVGIVRPNRTESNYRTYSVNDIYRVASCFMLKNVGYAVQDVADILDGANDAPSFVAQLINENEQRLAWHLAMRDALARVNRVCASSSTPEARLAYVDTWLAYFDKGETSYKNFDPEDAMAALLRSMPISSFGSIFDGRALGKGPSCPYRSFRCIPQKHVHLIPELTSRKADARYGGCACAVVTNRMSYSDIELFNSDIPNRATLERFMEHEGLRPCGPAFSINAWPAVDAIYCEINLPVRAANLKGASAIRKARAQHRAGH